MNPNKIEQFQCEECKEFRPVTEMALFHPSKNSHICIHCVDDFEDRIREADEQAVLT